MMYCRWTRPNLEEGMVIVEDEEFIDDEYPGIVIDKSNAQYFNITIEQTIEG